MPWMGTGALPPRSLTSSMSKRTRNSEPWKPARVGSWKRFARATLRHADVGKLISAASLTVAILSSLIAERSLQAVKDAARLNAQLQTYNIGLQASTGQPGLGNHARHFQIEEEQYQGERTLVTTFDFADPSNNPVVLEKGWLDLTSSRTRPLDCAAVVISTDGQQVIYHSIGCGDATGVPGHGIVC